TSRIRSVREDRNVRRAESRARRRAGPRDRRRRSSHARSAGMDRTSPSDLTAFLLPAEQEDEEGAAAKGRQDSDGDLGRRRNRARGRIGPHQKDGTPEKRGRDQQALIRAER